MKNRALTQIETALKKIVLWRGWQQQDRVLLRNLIGSIGELNRRYAARYTALRREEGSKHVQ